MAVVSIEIDDDLACWARDEAARRGRSLSRFVADAIEAELARSRQVTPTLAAFLSGPGLPGAAADLPERDELYDRRFRGDGGT